MNTPIKIERTFAAPTARVWDLYTTKEGIEAWWGPEGFRVDVLQLELRPGGRLHYTMTATGPAQVEYMKGAGLPLTNEAHATFGEMEAPRWFTYDAVVDFVPGVKPYTISNRVELEPVAGGTKLLLTVEPMHDAEWTERVVSGRNSQFDKLEALLASSPSS